MCGILQKRLMSDVPIGIFLRGCLDARRVASLMWQHVSHIHSFSVGLPHSPDLKAARLVAEHLGTIHHEYIYSEEEMQAVLSDVIYYLESYYPALVHSAIPCYIVSQLASHQYVKVVLCGEGADELFAGYSYFSNYDDSNALHQESVSIQSLAEAQAQGLPVSTQEESFYYHIFHQHCPYPDAAQIIGRWVGTLH